MNPSNKELAHLVDDTDKIGWERAFYCYTMNRVIENKLLVEDPRVIDCIYLLAGGSNKRRALIIGCGFGYVPIEISKIYEEVLAVDSNEGAVALLGKRCEESSIGNLKAVHTAEYWLSNACELYDLIFIADPNGLGNKEKTIDDLLKFALDKLSSDGLVYMTVENRYSLQAMLGRSDSGRISDSLLGIRKKLSKMGFDDVNIYAPLPSCRGIPLFFVPLNNNSVVRYFLRSVFPLFDMVSPEVRKQYGVQYAISKLGVRVACRLKLESVVKYLMPGYMVVAKKRSYAT